jgi:predicted membrane-bound spermidine synthase
MLVEIVLMQKFQKFIGNPNYTLIVILGGILFASGIGSFASRHMSPNIKIILVFFIPVLLLLKLFFLDALFIAFARFGFNSKLIISLCIITPISFLIGIPFPNALEVIKTRTSREFGALMFGISGFFSTLASVISILINVSYGFPASFMTGIALYLAGIFIFILIVKKQKA